MSTQDSHWPKQWHLWRIYLITRRLKTALSPLKPCPPGRRSLINMWSVLNRWVISSLHVEKIEVTWQWSQGVGSIITLGTRLIPAANFETEEGLDAVYAMLKEFLPIASPNIILGTPFLYKHTVGSTSVTPAWRNAIWHVSRTHSIGMK